MSAERTYDVVVFGATGFTGSLVAEYLARHAGQPVRWAIAGRSAERLKEVKEFVVALDPACADVGIIEADIRDWASLVLMASKARVVLTTVGPYIDNGENLVRACVSAGTDYVDITGEGDFVEAMVARFDAEARAKGLRIVHCCGLDSIPHDLGVLYTVNHLPGNEPIQIEGYVQIKGRFSGGTWQTAIKGMHRMGQARRQKDKEKDRKNQVARPGGAQDSRVRKTKPRFHREPRLKGWAFPLPTIDPKIVRMSARALERYGPDFSYSHYGVARSLANVIKNVAGVGVMFAMAQFGPTREYLLERHPSGEGPSSEERAANWFKVTFFGKSASKEVTTRVSGGDGGYGETAKMVAESALCLAFDRERLPDRAGVLTPAVAMGERLIERIERAGIRFEVLEER